MISKNIQYINNLIEIDNLSSVDEKDIKNLWIKVREDYMDWISETRLKQIKGKTLVKLFMWKGMSTWWLNKLSHKDSFINNKWLNRLFVIYFCKNSLNNVTLYTDDPIVIKTIYANKIDVRIIIASNKFKLFINKSKKSLFNIAIIIKSLLFDVTKIFILHEFRERTLLWPSNTPVIWFKTLFPTGCINNKIDSQVIDRMYTDTPLYDQENGFKSAYIFYIVRLFYKKKGGMFKVKGHIKSLIKQSHRDVFFPESLLSFIDILSAYSSTVSEQLTFFKLTKDDEFKSLFMINNIDMSLILFDEWSSTYWGSLQSAKLHGVASAKFFEKFEDGQTVVTYGEFFTRNRAEYFLTKNVRPKTCFISIQHASASKNKMFTYNRRSEFTHDGKNHGIDSSPSPDYFFVQGRKYGRILEEFFDSNRIRLVGSLSLQCNSKLSNNSLILEELRIEKLKGKKFILVSTSIQDYDIILNCMEQWKDSCSWNILLTAHPSTNINKIINYQQKNFPNLIIRYIESVSSNALISICDLIIASNSSISEEALSYSVQSVRLSTLNELPQFDFDEKILSFFSSHSFINWFEKNSADMMSTKNNIKDLSYDYFHKSEYSANQLFWIYAKEIVNKSVDYH